MEFISLPFYRNIFRVFFLKILRNFFSAGILKIPVGMLSLADIFSSTVKDFIMKSHRNNSEGSTICYVLKWF